MKRGFQILWPLFLFAGYILPVKATHIVGGEITYKCLGNNQYQIRLDIYVDCLNGEPTAIMQDAPAYIGIFDKSSAANYTLVDSIQKDIQNYPDIDVPKNFSNACVNNPPPTCLRRVSFVKSYFLPVNSAGYRVVYVRCCRNAAISNINLPSETGATYFCDIPGAAEAQSCNNSAVFKNYPPQIICINNPLNYDHSATDPDGDSLTYEFCDSYPGGKPGDPKPKPNPFLSSPISVSPGYVPPFTATNPMGGKPIIQIRPDNGLISGTPNQQGRFVVTVCCHEWRNGVKINTVKREFQFVVTNCSKAVVANIPQFSPEFNTYIVECNSNTVHFVNQSAGGFDYYWDFGVPGANSKDFEPTFTYPDTGEYMVKLVVNAGSTCPDSIIRKVKIFPTYSANFNYSGLQCPNAEMQFTDMSEATYKPVVAWNWAFGDGVTSIEQNPTHRFATGGDYNVQLISSSVKGCIDTSTQEVKIERFYPFAGNDTIIVRGEYINFRASGGVQYTWSPSDRLNTVFGSSPTGYYPDTGRYAYNVHIKSENQCEGDDIINVWVVAQSSLFVPSGFTPNGDGLNDVLRPIGIGYANLKYFRVFSRWGELMYKTDKLGEGWDGTFKGQLAEIGAYYWILDIVNRFGKNESIKGDATLIR